MNTYNQGGKILSVVFVFRLRVQGPLANLKFLFYTNYSLRPET